MALSIDFKAAKTTILKSLAIVLLIPITLYIVMIVVFFVISIYLDFTGPKVNQLLKLNEFSCVNNDKIVRYTHYRYPASSFDQDDFDIYLYQDEKMFVFVGGNEGGEGFKTSLTYFLDVRENSFLNGYENYSKIIGGNYDLKDTYTMINSKFVTNDKYNQILACVDSSNIKKNLVVETFKYGEF